MNLIMLINNTPYTMIDSRIYVCIYHRNVLHGNHEYVEYNGRLFINIAYDEFTLDLT